MRLVRPWMNGRMSQAGHGSAAAEAPIRRSCSAATPRAPPARDPAARDTPRSTLGELRDGEHHVQAALAIGDVQRTDCAQQLLDVRPAVAEGSKISSPMISACGELP